MTTRRDDGADQPRCHDEHDYQGNGRHLLSPYHGGQWSPWEPCPEPNHARAAGGEL